ncbi:MAG: hypothetical protein GXZ02_09765, partial [Clostridiales bacterium]|nr:hypothetical protein [Clostridiales bacterium]
MNEDILIKSVLFGGFDKNEVLKYIEKIQSEHYDESETIKRKDEERESLKEKVAQFEDKLASERRRFSALASLNDEYCERIYNLEEQMKEQSARFDNIQDDCNRLKKVEAQIGALLVDAVLYSDKMTEKAKTAATSITADAKNALVSTAEGVSELSSEIVQISSGFSNDITTLVEKVESLSASLSLFADRFETECDVSREKSYDAQEVFEHFFAQQNDEEKIDDSDVSDENEPIQPAVESHLAEQEEVEIGEIVAQSEHNEQPEPSDAKEEPLNIIAPTNDACENEATDIWDYETDKGEETKQTTAQTSYDTDTGAEIDSSLEPQTVEVFDKPEEPEE